MNRITLALIGVTVSYFYVYNNHFGWNMRPINDAEVICDGIGMILFALTILSIYIKK